MDPRALVALFDFGFVPVAILVMRFAPSSSFWLAFACAWGVSVPVAHVACRIFGPGVIVALPLNPPAAA